MRDSFQEIRTEQDADLQKRHAGIGYNHMRRRIATKPLRVACRCFSHRCLCTALLATLHVRRGWHIPCRDHRLVAKCIPFGNEQPVFPVPVRAGPFRADSVTVHLQQLAQSLTAGSIPSRSSCFLMLSMELCAFLLHEHVTHACDGVLALDVPPRLLQHALWNC